MLLLVCGLAYEGVEDTHSTHAQGLLILRVEPLPLSPISLQCVVEVV